MSKTNFDKKNIFVEKEIERRIEYLNELKF